MKKTLLIISIIICPAGLFSQVDSTAIELFKLANQDGKITRKEQRLINDILRANTFDLRALNKPTVPNDLNPKKYVERGLKQGTKMILFRLQSRIIEDLDKAGRQIIDGKN